MVAPPARSRSRLPPETTFKVSGDRVIASILCAAPSCRGRSSSLREGNNHKRASPFPLRPLPSGQRVQLNSGWRTLLGGSQVPPVGFLKCLLYSGEGVELGVR